MRNPWRRILKGRLDILDSSRGDKSVQSAMVVSDRRNRIVDVRRVLYVDPAILQRSLVMALEPFLRVIEGLLRLGLDVEAVDMATRFDQCLGQGESKTLSAACNYEDAAVKLQWVVSHNEGFE